MKKAKIHAIYGTAALLGMAPLPGWAQDAAPPPGEAAGQASVDASDIIVTARRRNERLQEVPLAVTAFGALQIERANIQSVSDLTGKVPSLVVTQSGFGQGTGTPNFAIRGLGTQEPSLLTDPAVTVYMNDVALPRPQGLNLGLYDLGGIEVAKGPQGTLFGRNVTGGAILIRPNQPVLRELAGEAAVTYSSFDTWQTNGMLNVPLGEEAALRIAVQSLNSNGYIRDIVSNRQVDTKDEISFRVGLKVEPSDTFSSLTFLNYARARDGGAGGKLVDINAASPFNAPATRAALNYTDSLETVLANARSRSIYDIASGLGTYTNIDSWSIDNTMTLALSDIFSLKNIAAYRKLKFVSLDDFDGTPYPILPIQTIIDQEQVSEEFQLVASLDWVDFIAGAYYFREHGTTISGISVTGGRDTGAVDPIDLTTYPGYTLTGGLATNKSYALFGQGTFKLGSLVEGLSVTAGLRQNWDDRAAVVQSRTATTCRFTVDQDNNPATPEVNPGLAGCNLPISASFNELTYNLSAEYKFAPGKLIYIAHRHGYRSGGLALRSSTQAQLGKPFLPEKVDDFEVGLKADWHIGGAFLRTNLAGFISDFSDIQRIQLSPNTIPLQNVTTNAAKAKIKGFEAEILFRPIQALELTGFWSLTDASYRQFTSLTGADLSGRPFALAPRNIYGFGGRINLPVGADLGSISAGGNFTHQDGYSDYDETDIFSQIAPYDLVSADVSWEKVAGTGLDLKVFVSNLLDKQYFSPLFHNVQLGISTRAPGKPRSVGVQARYRF
ncbi:TonB-dependent receptor [soil metagenome]